MSWFWGGSDSPSPAASESNSKDAKKQIEKLDEQLNELRIEAERLQQRSIKDTNSQTALIRRQKIIESKLVGLDRNRHTLSTQMAETSRRLELDKEQLNSQLLLRASLTSTVDSLEERQRNVQVNREANGEEMVRIQRQSREQVEEKNRLLARQKVLKKSRERLSQSIALLERGKEEIELLVEEMRKHTDMIENEVKSNEGKADDHVVTQLEQYREKLRINLAKLSQQNLNISSMREQVAEIEQELVDIALLLPTLNTSLEEVNRHLHSITRSEAELKRELTRIDTEAMSARKQLSKCEKSVAVLTGNISQLQSTYEDLSSALDKLRIKKEEFSNNLKRVQNGESTLATRLKKESQAMGMVESKQSELAKERNKLNRIVSIDPSSGRSFQAPVPTVKPTTVAIQYDTGKMRVTGNLTVTPYLVIFEMKQPKNKPSVDDPYKFCVDMQDVAASRLIDSRTDEDAMQPLESPSLDEELSRFARLEISFCPAFTNRFLFDGHGGGQAKGDSDKAAQVKFRGAIGPLRIINQCIHDAILYQEELASHQAAVALRSKKKQARKHARKHSSNGTHRSSHSRDSSSSSTGRRRHRSHGATHSTESPSANSTLKKSPSTSGTATGDKAATEQKDWAAGLASVEYEGKSSILSGIQILRLLNALPARFQLEKWQLVYNMTEDGASLKTFHQRLEDSSVSLIVIRDASGRTFGGFASQTWRQSPLYYGTGESFVFLFEGEQLQTFRWSGENRFFQISDGTSVAMGGGKSFAFTLDERFEHGASGPCSTYNCPMLSATPDFLCTRLEVWAPDE